jgi:hypothetical protein
MKTARRIVFGVVRAAIGVGLLAWVLSSEETLNAIADLFRVPWLLPAGALIIAGGGAIEALRLALLFRSQALRLSWLDAYRVICIGTFFNFCIPGGTGGDVMKLYYLAKGNAGRRVEVLTLLFVDRLIALVSVLLVIVALAAMSFDLVDAHEEIRFYVLVGLAILGASAVGTVLALSKRVRASRVYDRTLDALPMGAYLRRGADALYAFRDHRVALTGAFAVSLVGHGLLLVLIAMSGSVTAPDVAWLPMFLLTLLGMIANVLPLTPGGLGVGEAAIDHLFRIVGYGPGSPIIVAWRLSQLPLLALGCVLYVVGKKGGLTTAIGPVEPDPGPDEAGA